MSDHRTKLSPRDIARCWGISPRKVLTWIRNGQLRAIDVSGRNSSRPQYRVDVDDLAAFENRLLAPSSPKRPARRPRKDPSVIEFF